jgi:hypothetical protein
VHHPKLITKNVLHSQLHLSPSLTIHYNTPSLLSFSINIPHLTIRPSDPLRAPPLLTTRSSSSSPHHSRLHNYQDQLYHTVKCLTLGLRPELCPLLIPLAPPSHCLAESYNRRTEHSVRGWE